MPKLDLYADKEGSVWYDIAYDFPRVHQADAVERCLEIYGGRKGALLDVACGGGHFLKEMSSRGWEVSGIDQSSRMIEFARSRLGKHADLRVTSMEDFSTRQRFQIATSGLDSFTYLLSNQAIMGHLECVARLLENRGLCLIDLSLGRWADFFRVAKTTRWKPTFKKGWESRTADIVVYHDGCDGPPCDIVAHIMTEHMYFRVRRSGLPGWKEFCYQADKRALHPQEFAALALASGGLEMLGWFDASDGTFNLRSTLEEAGAKGRALVILRKKR